MADRELPRDLFTAAWILSARESRLRIKVKRLFRSFTRVDPRHRTGVKTESCV